MKHSLWLVALLTIVPVLCHAQSYCLRWVQRTDVGSPGDRAGHSMAYDIHRNVTVFFGGDVPGDNYFDETWEYDGTLWRKITIDGPVPPSRAMASMAYDEVAQYVVLAGGETSNGGLLKDTWIYRNTTTGHGTWTYAGDLITGLGLPAERAGASLTFDANSQKLVMIGGATVKNGDEYTHALIMRWDRDNGWEAHPGGGTLPVMGFNPTTARNGLARHFAAFDTDQNWLFFHGGWQGCYTEGTCDPDTDPNENPFYLGLKTNHISVLVESTASTDQGLQQGVMVYDSNRRRFVNFGGFNVGIASPGPHYRELAFSGVAAPADKTYVKLNAQATSGVLPSQRTRHAMVYDRARKVTVLYGGASGSLNFADTWELVPLDPERLQTPATSVTACEDTLVELGAHFRDPPPGFGVNSYHWLKNGQLLPSATGNLLSFPAVAPTDAGQYQYIVTTPCGHSLTQSPPTTLTIKLKPRITAFDTTRQDRCPGDSVSWSVTATGTPPLLYQWRRNALPLPGATNATLTLTNLQHASSGDYEVLVFNSCATATSAIAHLQVGVTIQAQPASISPNVCSTAGLSVSAMGVGPLRFQWRLDGAPIAGPLRTNIAGESSANLTIAPVHYVHDGNYDVIITDDCGPAHAVTSAVARVDVRPGAQWWFRTTNGPTRRFGHGMAYDAARGVTVLFGGRTNSSAIFPFNDLWEWNGQRWTQRTEDSATNGWVFVPGTGWRLSLTNGPVRRAHFAMAYDSRRGRVVIFGGSGKTPDGSVPTLRDLWEWDGDRWHFRTTNGPVARFNCSMAYDERRGRTVLFGGTLVGVNEPPDDHLVWEWDGDRWYTNRPPAMPPSSYYTGLARMTHDAFRGVSVFGPLQDNYGLFSFYDWDGAAWTNNAPVLYLSDPVLSAMNGTFQGGFAFDSNRRRSLWFGGYQLSPQNRTALFDGKRWTLLTNNPTPPPPRGDLAMAYDTERRAMVMFGGSHIASGAYVATNDTWELLAVDVPLINEHPASQFRQLGETATFRVQAVGPAPLSYQWYHANTLVTGANSDTLTISNVSSADAGEYRVLVSNDCGTRESLSASLVLALKLQILHIASTTTLSWPPAPNLVLESAQFVTGPWSVLSNAPNPFAINPIGPAKFFRLSQMP